jgi:hypothetical protein
MWCYAFADASLIFLFTPYASEITFLFWGPNINGWSCLMTVLRHPYGEIDKSQWNTRY